MRIEIIHSILDLEILSLVVEEIQVEGVSESEKKLTGVIRKVRKWLSLPGLQWLAPLARRATGVIEAPGWVSIRAVPDPSGQEPGCPRLTVISANLWHDWPQRRRALERLEAFALLVEQHQADILLLQEVARTTDFWTDRWLASRLNMAYVYSRANGHLQGIGFEEGVAVFSRFPLSQPVLRQLNPGQNQFVHRMALGTKIHSPCGDLLAFSVHLSLRGKRNANEVDHLADWIQSISGESAVLVGGDFNSGENSRQIKKLQGKWLDTFRHLNPFTDGATHTLRWPWGNALHRARLDYIFLKSRATDWKVVSASHLETPLERHSDHRAVLLQLIPIPIADR